MKPWRMIYWPQASPVDYIVTRPLVNDLRVEGKIPDTFMIYGVNKYFVAVGRHINIDDDVDMDNSAKRGVEIFRKIGGGGSGIWGPNSFQFAMAFGHDLFPSMEESLRVMIGKVLLQAVHGLGATAVQYKHVGDLIAGGRKLGGFAALPHGSSCVNMGGFLNIDDLDTSLAGAVLKTPEEKFRDKIAKDIRDYATSLRREAGREISRVDFVEAISRELERALEVKIEFTGLSKMEMDSYDRYRSQYTSGDWTFSKSSSKRFAKIPEGYRLGLSRHKSRKLVCAHVLLDREGKVAEAMLSGDYFIRPIDGDDQISNGIVGLEAADPEVIKQKIRKICEAIGFEAIMMTAEDFATPIIEACRKALATSLS
jgi:lipoate-protein ligase A